MGMFAEARKQRAAHQKKNPDSLLKYWDAALNAIPDAGQYFAHGVNFSTPGQAADIATIPQQLAGADPEKIPGTTENLRAKAGVRAPESLPEKIGYLGGQVAAPGPGEVAGMLGAGKAIFIGVKSKLARLDILDLAQRLEKNGAGQDEVWFQTANEGQPWFRDKDGHWKAEVPFSAEPAAELEKTRREVVRGRYAPPLRLEDAIGGNLGYEDTFGDISVHVDRGRGGSYWPKLREEIRVGDQNTGRTIAHEVQHPIQKREGWAGGTDPRWLQSRAMQELEEAINTRDTLRAQAGQQGIAAQLSEVEKRIADLSPQSTYAAALERYMTTSGEVLARNSAARAGMDADWIRDHPPWETQDRPFEKQWISNQWNTAPNRSEDQFNRAFNTVQEIINPTAPSTSSVTYEAASSAADASLKNLAAIYAIQDHARVLRGAGRKDLADELDAMADLAWKRITSDGAEHWRVSDAGGKSLVTRAPEGKKGMLK